MSQINQSGSRHSKRIKRGFAQGCALGTVPLVVTAFMEAKERELIPAKASLTVIHMSSAAEEPQSATIAFLQKGAQEQQQERFEPKAVPKPAPLQTVPYSDHVVYQQFIDHLILREGKRNDVYKDTKGYLTVGVGHKVLPEDNLNLGDVISDARVEGFLRKDARKAYEAAQDQMAELGVKDADFLIALGSVNFQLGTGWRSEFPKTWRFMMEGDFHEAAIEIAHGATRNEPSDWMTETPVRVRDFQQALRALHDKYQSYDISSADYTHPVRTHSDLALAYGEAAAIEIQKTLDFRAHLAQKQAELAATDLRAMKTNGAAVLRLVA